MKITKDTQADARRLMKLCLEADGCLNEERMRQIIAAIIEKRPRNYMALLTALRNLVKLHDKSKTVIVSSATPLTASQQEAIVNKLNARKAGLSYIWQQDESLIAGITVQLGDNLTDASVKSRIARLASL